MALSDGVAPGGRPDGQKGLFARRAFRKDEILVTLDGPVIDHSTRYSVQIDEARHVDGTPESNGYLNHSCRPNAYVDWNGVYLRALRDIVPGEEITNNYLTTDWELSAPFTCTCGAPECRGEIRGFRFLSPSEQRALGPFVPEFMRRRIA